MFILPFGSAKPFTQINPKQSTPEGTSFRDSFSGEILQISKEENKML